jgi:ribonuclease HI
MTRTTPLTLERAVRSLLSYTLTHWNRLTHSTNVKFIRRLTVDFTTLKLRRPLRSSDPNPKKKKPTDPGTIAAITSPPRGTPVYFLDGSANPNPGPAGAAAVLFVNGALVSRLCASLGHGTNNVGELYAFGIALTDLYSRLTTGPARVAAPCAYLVTDSEFALKLLQGTSKPCNIKSVVAQVYFAVRRLWRSVSPLIKLRIWKVASHTGVAGNEEADRVAGAAAARSTSTDSSNVHGALCAGNFAFLTSFA